ncbi:ABC transporter ATP-binding protein [Sphingosinicella sp. BN140058]|uniref:ABC transporter ATP-binding protein n=1 Tax=Sphingosinicella sp. BN140058 TaxID=1892855 RepID=UPI0010137B94|nr:ABC transporter ATP-binding protein [Sphingosinicella sp. BN140058]QAY78397.1 ABC transporter ATP-binding protein [Sphingosinicella sp. BN140058]
MSHYADLARFARPFRTQYLIAAVLLAAGTVCILVLPQRVSDFIADLPRTSGPHDSGGLLAIGVQILALALGQAALAALYTYIVSIVSERVGVELRARFFNRLMRQTLADDAGQQAGAKASEFISDLAIIQSAYGDTAVSFVRHILFTIGALIAMFLVDVRMAATTLISTAVVAGVIGLFVAWLSRSLVRMQVERSRVVASLLEAAGNRYVIQAFRKEAYFQALFDATLDRAFRIIRQYQRIAVLINPVAFVILSIAVSVIVLVGVEQVAAGRMRGTEIVTFLTYAVILVAAISQAGMTAGQLRQAQLMYRKHEKMLQDDPVVAAASDPSPPSDVVDMAAGYRFHDVDYTYPGSAVPALRDVSFFVPAGRTTALIGESGSGKSTVAALLMGLLRPQRGRIDRGDQPGLGIGIVPQEPFLFRATIADNIRFGRAEIDEAAIRRSAQAAQINDHIMQLPDRFQHMVSEDGDNLSRGQQQRIALARALAGRPGTLVLDEATASLDVASERAIGVALKNLRGQTTIVVIAHQGSLIDDVDHLVVMKAGRVVFEGSPADWRLNGNNSFVEHAGLRLAERRMTDAAMPAARSLG